MLARTRGLIPIRGGGPFFTNKFHFLALLFNKTQLIDFSSFKDIFHTSGPTGNDEEFTKDLKRCYENCLEKMKRMGLRTLVNAYILSSFSITISSPYYTSEIILQWITGFVFSQLSLI